MASDSNAAVKENPHELRPAPSSDIISLSEASKFLGVHKNTVYQLIRDKEIPAFRLTTGGRWKFRKSELEQWLDDKQSRARL